MDGKLPHTLNAMTNPCKTSNTEVLQMSSAIEVNLNERRCSMSF